MSVSLVITCKKLHTSYTIRKYDWLGQYDSDWDTLLPRTRAIVTKPPTRIEYEEDDAIEMSFSVTPANIPSLIRWSFWDGSGAREEQPPIFKQILYQGEEPDNDQAVPLTGAEGDVTTEGEVLTTSVKIDSSDTAIHSGQYSMLLVDTPVTIRYFVDVRTSAASSTFPVTGIELEISSSDYQYISEDNTQIALIRGQQNAILCRASGVNVKSMELTHNGQKLVSIQGNHKQQNW